MPRRTELLDEVGGRRRAPDLPAALRPAPGSQQAVHLLDRLVDRRLGQPQPLGDVPRRLRPDAHPQHEAVVLDPLVALGQRLVGVGVLGDREQAVVHGYRIRVTG